MSTPIITVEHLSKRYQLGQIGATTLRDSAERLMHRLRRHAVTHHSSPVTSSAPPGVDAQDFWALKDVSFEVQPGEVLGIIGRNGAGKSTLLKILSRITEPTSGRAIIRGRVASLLEVGTGFHPELSGRENIYLNGAILGMRHSEIARKFDEIVDFAEIGKFIDTPVKRYSSGMYVRLAFAVAAHLEPEILVIDEVLAVGDSEFQSKCLGKMKDVSNCGRTVLFVSHNMTAIHTLCSKVVLLEKGRISLYGGVSSVLEQYLDRPCRTAFGDLSLIHNRKGAGRIIFSNITLTDHRGCIQEMGVTGETLQIHLKFTCQDASVKMRSRIGIALRSRMQASLFVCSTEMTLSSPPQIGDGDTIVCTIPRLPLGGGCYGVMLFIDGGGVVQDFIDSDLTLTVEDRSFFSTGRNCPQGWDGTSVLVDHNWLLKPGN